MDNTNANDNGRILERIEGGSLQFEEVLDGLRIKVHVEAADSLGLLLRRIAVESDREGGVLQKQAAAVVDRLAYLDELKVIEVDGISHAVQIRSRKPGEDGFNEVILRRGNFVSFERHGAGLYISKKHFERLLGELTQLFSG